MTEKLSRQIDDIVAHLLAVPQANVLMLLGSDRIRTSEVVNRFEELLKKVGVPHFKIERHGDYRVVILPDNGGWRLSIRHTSHQPHELQGMAPTQVFLDQRIDFPYRAAVRQLGRRPDSDIHPTMLPE